MPPSSEQSSVVITALEYEAAVLNLPAGVTEQDLEEQCYHEARRLGVLPQTQDLLQPCPNDPRASLVSFTPSATTISTTSVRSPSIDSRNSISTDIISNLSRNSTDRRRSHVFSLPLRSFSRLSSRDTNTNEAGVRTSVGSSGSFPYSSPSVPSSINLSLSNSSLHRPFSVRRGLGRLAMFKRSSQYSEDGPRSPTCYRCPNSALNGESALQLDCGHTICYEHFLQLLANAETRPHESPATCCGPRVQRQIRTSHSSTQHTSIKFHEPIPVASDVVRIRDVSTPCQNERGSARSSVVSQAMSPEAKRNLAEAMTSLEFSQARREQTDIPERFFRLWAKQQAVISDYYATGKNERVEQQEKQVGDLREAQLQALSKLEEQQLTAEIDLREVHELEKCNCSLALRHMEGYVESGRTVTEQDRRELEKQYWVRNNLQLRHESGINVLREQQARRMRIRSQAQEKEMAVLKLKFQRSIDELDRSLRVETQELRELFLRRREKLVVRWGLLDEIWRRGHNEKENNKIDFPIAPLDWPMKEGGGDLTS